MRNLRRTALVIVNKTAKVKAVFRTAIQIRWFSLDLLFVSSRPAVVKLIAHMIDTRMIKEASIIGKHTHRSQGGFVQNVRRPKITANNAVKW